MRAVEEKDLFRSVRDYAVHVDTVISQDLTIEEALSSLRQRKSSFQKVIYFYVVDDQHHLKGVISTRQLLLSSPGSKVSNIMQDWVAKLKVSHTIKDALEIFDQYPLLALPVVDHDGKLMGAIDVQMVTKEVMDLADLNNRVQLFQMIGLTIQDGKKFPLIKSFLHRMPWLICNVFSGIICAIITRIYEHVVYEFIILAFFVPLVLTLTESISMQSMAQSLQFLRRPHFSWKIACMKGFQEWQTASLLAMSSGLMVFSISYLWNGNLAPSLIIGFGIIFSVLLSSIFGVFIPILLHRMKLDPKVAAGPVVLMITDMVTIALYLSIAAYWLLPRPS